MKTLYCQLTSSKVMSIFFCLDKSNFIDFFLLNTEKIVTFLLSFQSFFYWCSWCDLKECKRVNDLNHSSWMAGLPRGAKRSSGTDKKIKMEWNGFKINILIPFLIFSNGSSPKAQFMWPLKFSQANQLLFSRKASGTKFAKIDLHRIEKVNIWVMFFTEISTQQSSTLIY